MAQDGFNFVYGNGNSIVNFLLHNNSRARNHSGLTPNEMWGIG